MLRVKWLLSATMTVRTFAPNGLRQCTAQLLDRPCRTTTVLPSSSADLPVRTLPFIFFVKRGVSIEASMWSSLRSEVQFRLVPPVLFLRNIHERISDSFAGFLSLIPNMFHGSRPSGQDLATSNDES